jgi:D-3-phosphoglycerate dehydrogenase
MVSQITDALAAAGLNIEDLLNKSRDKYAYTLIGLKADAPPKTRQLILYIKGMVSARIILGAENKILRNQK